jgi:outer membrane protein assembly factor BamA
LRRVFYIFLYLNIYTLLFTEIDAQVLNLSVEAEISISEGFQDTLQIQKSFKDYLSLKQEVDAIPGKLQHLGFIDSELRELIKVNDSSFSAHYYFGKRYSYIKVYYSDEDFSKKEIAAVATQITESFFILPFDAIERSLQKLNSYKTESGNAFAKINLRDISKEIDGSLSANLVLERGLKRSIDSIVVKGYEKFPKSFLKYYAGIKKGKVFSQKKLLTQNELINSLPFASSIKPPEALFRKDSTVVYFYLDKRNANLFDGVLGFATNEKTQKLQFNGYLNLELNNNLNYGEQLSINYKADGEEQRNFRVRANLPYLLKSPFGIGLELKIFKRDSTFVTTEQLAKVGYQINPSSSAYLGYKGYVSSNLLDDILAGSSIEDFTSRFLIAGAAYTKPQRSSLFPIKTSLGLDAEIGSRDLKNSSDDQVRFLLLANHIFNLNFKNSIYLQNNTSLLLSETILTNELFRFGGITSIRGFDENSIDASFLSTLNTEYRYQFNAGLFLHSIIDIGYFENKTLALKEKLYSYGIGLGLLTKAGLLKLNIANGNSEKQAFNFSNTKIHIILSSRF